MPGAQSLRARCAARRTFGGTREFLVVGKGRVRVESGRDGEGLNCGDSATRRAGIPHAIVNLGKGEAMAFPVDIHR